MFAFSPVPTPFHRLDPRVKLFCQGAIAVASFAATDVPGTAGLVAIAAGTLRFADVSIARFLHEVRYVLVLLGMAPVAGAIVLGAPWIDPAAAIDPGLAALRVLALLAVGLVYVRSTAVRESQAAIQWVVPGRPGRLLAVGVGLVFRFLPTLRDELGRTRDAIDVRGGAARPVHDRMGLVAASGLQRTVDRSDRVTRALLARCLAWNPTLPPLATTRADVPAILAGLGILAWALV